MLPFFQADLSISWSPFIYCVDAGPLRTAVCRARASLEQCRILGRLAERGGWLLHELPAAASIAIEAVEDAILKVAPPVEVDSNWWDPHLWQLLFNPKLRKREHNTISEVRACLQAIRHNCSSFSRWHKRVVILSDAGAAIGAYSKGRSSSNAANQLCRQAASIVFSCDVRVYFRWIASAHNIADGPSRGLPRPGVDVGTVGKARVKLRRIWDEFARQTQGCA